MTNTETDLERNEIDKLRDTVDKLRYLMSRMQNEKDRMESLCNDLLTEKSFYRDVLKTKGINPDGIHFDDDGILVELKVDNPNEGLTPNVGQMLDTISRLESEIKSLREVIDTGRDESNEKDEYVENLKFRLKENLNIYRLLQKQHLNLTNENKELKLKLEQKEREHVILEEKEKEEKGEETEKMETGEGKKKKREIKPLRSTPSPLSF